MRQFRVYLLAHWLEAFTEVGGEGGIRIEDLDRITVKLALCGKGQLLAENWDFLPRLTIITLNSHPSGNLACSIFFNLLEQ